MSYKFTSQISLIFEVKMINNEKTAKEIFSVMSGIMLALLLASLDNTIVSTAMPQITSNLKGLLYYSLPFTSYLLFSTVVIPIAGKLSDLYSRKNVMLTGLVFFLIASMLCGMSGSFLVFVFFRGLQGVGGGILTSGAFILTSEYFPQRERGKYIGMLASMYGLASLIGPIAGGLITEYLSWRWVFYVNIPIGLCSFLLMYKNVPHFRHRTESKKLDIKGIVVFLLAIFPLLFGISESGKLIEWGSPLMIGLFLTSAIMFILFVKIEKQTDSPLLPTGLLSNIVFRHSAVCAFFGYVALFGIILYVPYLLQIMLKKGAAYTGMVMLPMSLSMLAGGTIGGFLISKFQRYRLIGSAAYFLASCGIISLISGGTAISTPALVISLIMTGFGIGISFPVYNIAPQGVIPAAQLGILISTLEFFQIMGGVISTAVLGAFLSYSLFTVGVISLAALIMAAISIMFIDEQIVREGIIESLETAS